MTEPNLIEELRLELCQCAFVDVYYIDEYGAAQKEQFCSSRREMMIVGNTTLVMSTLAKDGVGGYDSRLLTIPLEKVGAVRTYLPDPFASEGENGLAVSVWARDLTNSFVRFPD